MFYFEAKRAHRFLIDKDLNPFKVVLSLRLPLQIYYAAGQLWLLFICNMWALGTNAWSEYLPSKDCIQASRKQVIKRESATLKSSICHYDLELVWLTITTAYIDKYMFCLVYLIHCDQVWLHGDIWQEAKGHANSHRSKKCSTAWLPRGRSVYKTRKSILKRRGWCLFF